MADRIDVSIEHKGASPDAKPEKRAARTMLRMVHDLNANYIARLNEHDQTVGCVTCHRGHPVPEIALAPLPERGPRPQQQPGAGQPQPEPAPAPPPPM